MPAASYTKVAGSAPDQAGSIALMKGSSSPADLMKQANAAFCAARNGRTDPSSEDGASRETEITDRPRGRISRSSDTNSGNSSRHGSHQVAQKLSTTTRPRWRDSSAARPSLSMDPTDGAAAAPRAAARIAPAD